MKKAVRSKKISGRSYFFSEMRRKAHFTKALSPSVPPVRIRRGDLSQFKEQIDEELEFVTHGRVTTSMLPRFPYRDYYLAGYGVEQVTRAMLASINFKCE